MIYDGLTIGVTLGYQLPVSSVSWTLQLEAPISITINSNGFDIGNVVLNPITVDSSQSQFAPIVSFIPNANRIPDLRDTITAITDGYDTVFAFSGASNQNLISELLSGIHQNFLVSNVGSKNPNAPSTFGKLALSLVSTIRTLAELDATLPVIYNPTSLVISAGTIHVDVYFGHTQTCGANHQQWCINGQNVASADTLAPLRVIPNPSAQDITLRASLFHSGGVLSESQNILDTLISRYIWAEVMPLQVIITLTPLAGNNYGYTSPFTIQMFFTIPPGHPVSGFIAGINVNILGTLQNSIGNVHIDANMVINNTMSFPLIFSYYQFIVNLADTDGVDSGFCIGTGGLVNLINPCSINLCYDPWSEPSPIAPLISSGPYSQSQFQPANSILSGVTQLQSYQTAPTTLLIDSTIETTARLYDEMDIKGFMCGGIADGLVVITLQADPTCNDAGKLEANLQCSFPVRIYFNLTTYAFSKVDTCGSQMPVSPYLPLNYYTTGWYQFSSPWSSQNLALNAGTVQATSGTKQAFGRSDNHPITITDAFEISFDFRAASAGCIVGGEALALNFLTTVPSSASEPTPTLNCGFFSCSSLYAVSGMTTTGNFASLILGIYGCNSIGWAINGDFANLYRKSESCAGAPIDNGNWGTVTFAYDASDKRGRITYAQTGYPTRYFAFDLDLQSQLQTTQAYLSISANTAAVSCSSFYYRNLVFGGPRTNGTMSIIMPPVNLVRVGQMGQVTFQARDDEGRYRGLGGNTWSVLITNGDTSTPAVQASGSPTVVDNDDGTYTINYNIQVSGRYIFQVACNKGSPPNICNSYGVYATISNDIFVMS